MVTGMKTPTCKKKLMGVQQMKMQWKSFKNLKISSRTKKSNIIWLAYYQGQIFQKFKEREYFVSTVLKLNVTKSTIIFKIAVSKLIDDYPKIKGSLLSLHYLKKHLKMITEICKENANEFK